MVQDVNKKTILIYPNGKFHSLYNPLLNKLSDNYNLIYNSNESKQKKKIMNVLYSLNWLRVFYHKYIRKHIGLNDLTKNKKPTETFDLVYASNSIPVFDCKFIIDLEMISALSGYNFSSLNIPEIRKRFKDSNCKSIICWNNTSYNTLIKTIDCSDFLNKIKIVPFAIASKEVTKEVHPKNINFLFVSSTNNPQDFELKGGLIL